jgi:hypothetical protein
MVFSMDPSGIGLGDKTTFTQRGLQITGKVSEAELRAALRPPAGKLYDFLYLKRV